MLPTVTGPEDRRRRALRAVASVDPVGLVAAGAPYDEYAPEVDRLLPLAPVTVEQVRAVWSDMFDDHLGALSEEQARQIADAVNDA